jgi:hypothetical protein
MGRKSATYKTLFRALEGQIVKLEDNIKMNVKECTNAVDWIYLAQGRC